MNFYEKDNAPMAEAAPWIDYHEWTKAGEDHARASILLVQQLENELIGLDERRLRVSEQLERVKTYRQLLGYEPTANEAIADIEWLTAKQMADRLDRSTAWVYKHSDMFDVHQNGRYKLFRLK